MKCLISTAAALALLAPPAFADPVQVSVETLSGFQKLGSNDTFGPFQWRGGMELGSSDPHFGGFSGLSVSSDCSALTAISDAGRWFTADLAYVDGVLSAVSATELAPMLDSKGRPQRNKVWGDAEAMARVAPGRYAVAYESRVRIGTYDMGRHGTSAPFQQMAYPREIDRGPDNGEIEAIGLLPDKRFIAISESAIDDGAIRAWVWGGTATTRFSLKQHGDYRVTDLVVMPDGTILTLERSFSRTSLPGMAIRRFAEMDISRNAMIEPELLFDGRFTFYAIDNMEAIGTCERDGETRITIMSDNNFNTALQRNLLLQFAYRP